jgi:hypothetical protein
MGTCQAIQQNQKKALKIVGRRPPLNDKKSDSETHNGEKAFSCIFCDAI